MKPLIYGYLRVTDDLEDHQIRSMERGLQNLAEVEGFRFATTFHEDQPGYQGAFTELTRELQRADAHHVVVPSLEHLSPHPLLQDLMLTCLAREADAHLWVVAPSLATITGLCDDATRRAGHRRRLIPVRYARRPTDERLGTVLPSTPRTFRGRGGDGDGTAG